MPGMLQSMGLQRVRHALATEQGTTTTNYYYYQSHGGENYTAPGASLEPDTVLVLSSFAFPIALLPLELLYLVV